jgi:SAM-dependent methyltransferase
MGRMAAPYRNDGNSLVLSMIPPDVGRMLDVGCGAGDIARHLRSFRPDIEVVGVTHSPEEAQIAAPYMQAVHVLDLEKDLLGTALADLGPPFDLLMFSHVLEHLVDPVAVLRTCLARLAPGGHVLIAVPNVLEWRTRLQFLRGSFAYADHGILDRTHLRFFTYETAPEALVSPIAGLRLLDRRGRGAVPLGPLRKLSIARDLWSSIDRAGVTAFPNIFARETAMLARWGGASADARQTERP